MNEELKIVIKAVTDDAEKNLADVKKELKEIDKETAKTQKSINISMASVAKRVATATAAIAAATAAMTGLAKSALEAEKGFAKLNTTFKNVGSSAEQATDTYRELYGFLGNHDKAIETAQSLALITTNTKDLAEWTDILNGAYAIMGDKLPIEGLAEAANETIKTGVVTGQLADALNWMGVSEDAFNASLAQTTSLQEREALVRSTLNNLYGNAASAYKAANKATIQYNQSQANLNLALSQAAQYTTPLLTAFNNLGSSLLINFAPALRTVALYLTAFIQLLAEAIAWVGNFFGMASSGTDTVSRNVEGYQKAMVNYTNALQNSFNLANSSLDETSDQIEKVKKQTMGFDELNIISNPSTAASDSGEGIGGALSKLPAMPNPSDYGIGAGDLFNLSGFEADIEEAKEKLQGLITILALIAAGVAAIRLTKFIGDIYDAIEAVNIMKTVKIKKNGVWENFVPTAAQLKRGEKGKKYLNDLKATMKDIVGKAMTVGGAAVYIGAFMDAWANDIDWGNLALLIGGATVAVTGLALAYGSLYAAIGLVVASLGLMIIGVKDFINNGPTLENTILIIGGAISIAVGLATAGLSVLISVIVAAVTAIGAFVAAILLEKPAIQSVEEAQRALTEAKEAAMEAEMGYVNAVDAAENALNRLQNAEKAAGITGAELYQQVQDGVIDYANMTAEQRELYKAYLDNEKKQKELEASTKALEEAKKAETIASYEHQLALAKESGDYGSFKESVIAAFEAGKLSADEARDLISKSMSEMSDASQKTFMEDIPSDLKKGLDPHQYESTGTKIKKWFQNTGNTIGTWFSELLWKPIKDWWNNKVKPIFTKQWWADVFKSVQNGIKSAINGIIQIVENGVNFIIRKINTLSWKIPDWVPGIGGGTFGFNFKLISIPKLAEGGIVNTSILANIGENGKEAVLPLENNTGWMDKLAEKIAARNRTQSKIVLKLNDRELGWAVIDSINNITTQTGGLQLAL